MVKIWQPYIAAVECNRSGQPSKEPIAYLWVLVISPNVDQNRSPRSSFFEVHVNDKVYVNSPASIQDFKKRSSLSTRIRRASSRWFWVDWFTYIWDFQIISRFKRDLIEEAGRRWYLEGGGKIFKITCSLLSIGRFMSKNRDWHLGWPLQYHISDLKML